MDIFKREPVTVMLTNGGSFALTDWEKTSGGVAGIRTVINAEGAFVKAISFTPWHRILEIQQKLA